MILEILNNWRIVLQINILKKNIDFEPESPSVTGKVLNETHLDAVRGLIKPRDFAWRVSKESSSERRNYVQAEKRDPLYADAKGWIQSRKK